MSREDILIRAATLADAQSIASLCTQLGYPTSAETMQQRLIPLQHQPNHALFVAEYRASQSDGVVTGWVHAHWCDLVIAPPQAIVFGLVVDERYRGCGIGQQLMQQVEQWARSQGCEAVLVRSNIVRQAAHQFYGRIGYTVIKQSLVFYKKLE